MVGYCSSTEASLYGLTFTAGSAATG